MTTDKIGAHHLAPKAILYVRQSSPHQVLHNRESRTLQYAMRDRLAALGFSDIETIDDDLGRSAAGGIARAGFERMVADVCLGKVGAVAAREVSRFARKQPRLAAIDRDVPGRRHAPGRSGDGLCAEAGQRSPPARTQGKPERVRTRSAAPTLARRSAYRGRDAHCWAPPAQIRTGPIRASGSYLGCLTSKRTSGQG